MEPAPSHYVGMIMVQSKESARFDGMPRAAASTGLDMPKQLLSSTKHPCVTEGGDVRSVPADGDALTRIFALLREKTKVDFTFYKSNTISRRIERRMTINQISDIKGYADYLNTYPGEAATLYREFLIGVTNFFRDPEAFEELDQKWLAERLQTAKGHELRCWIPGCSTGEEAYTLAIIIREGLDRLGISKDVKIFATDIDRDVIQTAGTGIYPDSIAADISPRILTKYFYKRDDHFQIARNIREMIVFAQHNLIKDPPFTNIELLSCRNLLIYLQPVLQKKVLDFFNFSLNPRGILILGTSETTGEMSDYFEVLSQKYKLYRSKGRLKQVLLPGEFHTAGTPAGRGGSDMNGLGRPVIRTLPRMQEQERVLDRFMQGLVGDFIPLSIVVNENLEVLHILGDTEGYFKLPSGRIINDISKMATKDLAIPLSTGIQKVFRTGEEQHYSNVRLSGTGVSRLIDLKIKPLPQKKGQAPLAAVFISKSAQAPMPREGVPAETWDVPAQAEQHIRDLERELQFIRENLQATIEELETSNEELQATNEELLSSNEELQSANEELHTINTEYQPKIIDFTELTNDIDNLLSNTQVGILLLDENMEIRRFSPYISRLFKLLDSDIGTPLTHLTHYIETADPIDIIEQVQRSGKMIEREIKTRDDRWYLMRVIPYSIAPGTFAGTVMTFIDITTARQETRALMESRLKMDSILDASPIGIGFLAVRIIQQVNRRMREMTGYSEQELLGKDIRSLYPGKEEYDYVGKELYDQIREHGVGTIETAWKRKDGNIINILLSSSSILEDGSENGVSFTALDITERVVIENEKRKLRNRGE